MAGIKFHGAVDSVIRGNHIYRTSRGIWLDWMTQGTRVTGNLLHDNGPSEDLFVEVNHGPFVVDNNLLLSDKSILVNSQGAAYVHNLILGRVIVSVGERRQTPALEAHSTAVAGLHANLSGDERYYNNIFVNHGLTDYDQTVLPVYMSGNVFVAGAKASKHESNPVVLANVDPQVKLLDNADGVYLEMVLDPAMVQADCPLVTTALLGKAKTPELPYEQPDGSPYVIDTDYLGHKRDTDHVSAGPFAGPFAGTDQGKLNRKVW
jgi:alpha-N-arabinofuranosidase